MKRKTLLATTIIAIIIITLTGIKTLKPQQENIENNKIGVIVTIPPQAEPVERIGGEKVEVTIMVPPGASPHTYEPKPSQLEKVSKAKIYAKLGSGIEFELTWTDKITQTNKKILIADCAKGIKLIEKDPHIWLSPKNMKKIAENIYQALTQVDPKNKEYYKKNMEKYLEELEKLDEEIRKTLKNKQNKKIMVYHPAWTYFCREYGLEQIPIEKEGKEPTPKEVIALVEKAKKNNIKIVFVSPQFNTKTAEVIAKEIGGKVVPIDPLEKNYLENMRKIIKTFAEV